MMAKLDKQLAETTEFEDMLKPVVAHGMPENALTRVDIVAKDSDQLPQCIEENLDDSSEHPMRAMTIKEAMSETQSWHLRKMRHRRH